MTFGGAAMNATKKALIASVIVLCSFLSVHFSEDLFFGLSTARAQESWKAEFDDICSKIQDAMAYTAAELKSFVERCDKLKPQIEKLEESQKKVYMRRLQLCRDLFSFVLETKEKN